MATIVTRSGKGSALTHQEMDDNFTNLNTGLTQVEGTEIKSTGETGGTKYLREDGDGTCSWVEVSGLPDAIDVNASAPADSLAIDSSGNVGIGQTNPAGKLEISDGSTALIRVNPASSEVDLLALNSGGTGYVPLELNASYIRFDTSANERMRIDTSGHLLVGTTDATVYNQSSGEGVVIEDNAIQIARDGNVPLLINRQTNDGEIMQFRLGGTFEGAIYIINKDGGDQVVFGSSNTGLMFNDSIDSIHPFNGPSSSNRDNTVDMGSSVNRFDDIYATNGTIQTSDQNEKQQIASLTDAEMNVAKRLSALFKTFKWNSSVEENGDNARTHSGIIAQDMQQAFTDEGLDAGNYAMFISSTWWEKEISVDAVEAVEGVEATYDEEGNELTPAVEEVEGKDAYTYIDTKQEATDGYTEKTRLGVRYPELFAFINAYNDQRFADLEARITALEA